MIFKEIKGIKFVKLLLNFILYKDVQQTVCRQIKPVCVAEYLSLLILLIW